MCSAQCPAPTLPWVRWYGPKFGGPKPYLFCSVSRFPTGRSLGAKNYWKANDARQKRSIKQQDQRRCTEVHVKYNSFQRIPSHSKTTNAIILAVV